LPAHLCCATMCPSRAAQVKRRPTDWESRMTSPWVRGGAAGLLAGATAVASNLRRGEPHLISIFPDLLTFMIVGTLVWLAVWGVRTDDRVHANHARRQTTLVASSTFAVCIGAFAWWYLPSNSILLAGFAALSGFVLTYLVGFVATTSFARRTA
jgi:hypothetical protein